MYFRTLFSPQSIVVMYITRNSRHIGLRPKSDYKIGTYLSIYLSIYLYLGSDQLSTFHDLALIYFPLKKSNIPSNEL